MNRSEKKNSQPFACSEFYEVIQAKMINHSSKLDFVVLQISNNTDRKTKIY